MKNHELKSYQLFQKLKLIGISEFNYLTNILTLHSHVSLESLLISGAQHIGYFTFKVGHRVQTEFELRTTYSDTMLNYRLSQRFNQYSNIYKLSF